MKKILAKSKSLRHRYKRYAAVLAGAAIMAGSVPGIPASIVAASGNPTNSPLVTTEQNRTVSSDYGHHDRNSDNNRSYSKRDKGRNGWHEHNNSWPSSNDNQGWVENGKISYRGDNNNDRSYSYNNYGSSNYNTTLISPVGFVREYASLYGFDRNSDVFTLLSASDRQATVQVVKHSTGQILKVDLENRGGWRIVAIRGIGDTNNAATYESTGAFSPY